MERILKLQFALFFQANLSRPDHLMNPLNSDMGNLFDAMPQILPIPEGAPADIPRVVLRSEDNRYNCNISSSRIDLIFNFTNEDDSDWPDITKDFLLKSKLFMKSIKSNADIIRFGLVGNFFFPDKNNSSVISRKYLRIDMTSAEEINLRFNKRVESHGYKLNNITSVNTAVVDDSKGIFVELDVNNVPDGNKLDFEKVSPIIDKYFQTFSPEQVKGLLK